MNAKVLIDALVVVWFACAFVAVPVAWKKGRSATLWPFFGLLLGPTVLVVLLALPAVSGEKSAPAGLFVAGGRTLASRGSRFVAGTIDGVLLAVPGALLGLAPLPAAADAGLAFAALALWVRQLFLLAVHGQTIGKRALGLRVVLQDTGGNGGFTSNVLLRVFAQALLCAVPGYLIADALFLFREDRRCLHDRLAGTVVVRDLESVP